MYFRHLFDGQFFAPNLPAVTNIVTFGPLPDADQYMCQVLPDSSSTKISCLTPFSCQGSSLSFKVQVENQFTLSDFVASFPTTPFIYQAMGCGVTQGNGTAGCSTEGGDLLTIIGKNFVQTGVEGGLTVSVGGRVCREPGVDVASLGTRLTCIMPSSTGGTGRSIIVSSLGQSSEPAPLIGYAPPTITTISGCVPSPTGSEHSIVNCPTGGGSRITLTGINFGVDGAVILIGNSLCLSVSHGSGANDNLNPNRYVECSVPSGTGIERPVLLLQGGGGIGSNTSLSYTECQPGTYIVGLGCLPCATGQFSAIPSSPECRNCYGGTYSDVYQGASFCHSCPAGRVSEAGRSSCTNCSVGEYVSAAGQASCIACVPGTYSNRNATEICTVCPVGRSQPLSGQSTCVDCEVGKANAAVGQIACASCSPGTFRATTGGVTCQACAPGTSQPGPGQASCVPCLKGSFSDGGVASCTTCIAGTMAPEEGLQACLSCPLGSTSNVAFTLCDCYVGFYGSSRSVDMTCKSCPDGALCNSTGVVVDRLIAMDGWWRADNETLSFFRCLRDGQCLGGGCALNRAGPLCSICAEGYTPNGQGQDCTPCPSRGASVGGTFGYIVLLLAAIFVVFYLVWRSEPAKMTSASPYLRVKAWSIEDRSAPNYAYNFKIILSYFQIASTLVSLVEIPWPSAFQKFIQAMSFVNLDFIPYGTVACVATLTFYDKLVLIFLLPIAVLALVVAVPWFLLWFQNRVDYSDDSRKRNERSLSRRKIIKLVVFALFLMYPSVSSTVLSFFLCRTVAGTSYLVADFRLLCGDARWNSYLGLAVLALIVYPIGIPVVLFLSLWNVRHRLKHATVLVSFGLAYDAYLTKFWWWELVDMISKLFLTSLLQFFPAGAQCPVGMSICVTYLISLLLLDPYVRKIDDRMCCFVQVRLCVCVCVCVNITPLVFFVTHSHRDLLVIYGLVSSVPDSDDRFHTPTAYFRSWISRRCVGINHHVFDVHRAGGVGQCTHFHIWS